MESKEEARRSTVENEVAAVYKLGTQESKTIQHVHESHVHSLSWVDFKCRVHHGLAVATFMVIWTGPKDVDGVHLLRSQMCPVRIPSKAPV